MPHAFRTSFRNVIYDVLKARGWKETEGMDWDFHWAEKEWVTEFMDGIHLNPCRRQRPKGSPSAWTGRSVRPSVRLSRLARRRADPAPHSGPPSTRVRRPDARPSYVGPRS